MQEYVFHYILSFFILSFPCKSYSAIESYICCVIYLPIWADVLSILLRTIYSIMVRMKTEIIVGCCFAIKCEISCCVSPLVLLNLQFLLLHLSTAKLNQGSFHGHLRDRFAPLLIRYVDLMESSIARSLDKSFAKETWQEFG